MKDDNGLYYYPDATDTRTRVYVRQGRGDVEFRLWRQDVPEIWERHPWLPFDVVTLAASHYTERGSGSDPLTLYDHNVARALIKDENRKAR